MASEEEIALKRKKAEGQKVAPEDLPIDLRVLRLEHMIDQLLNRIEKLEITDRARGLSGIRIGGRGIGK